MTEGAPSRTRNLLLRTAAVVAALAAVAGALRLGGAFTDSGEDAAAVTTAAPASKPSSGLPAPEVETIGAVDHPIAVVGTGNDAWVADGLDPTASRIEIPYQLPLRTSYSLSAPSTAVATGEGAVWFALQREAIERLELGDPGAVAQVIELDEHPAAVEVGAGHVWALGAAGIERIDPASGEVTDTFSAGGFANALAVTPEAVWVVADNREVRRLDPESGETVGELVEVPDAVSIAVDGRYAWVASAAGSVTRIDVESMAVVGEPAEAPDAVDVAVGAGDVWVAGAGGEVTRLDARSGAPVGGPIEAGRRPVSISTSGKFVWVANAGGGSVTRIAP